MLSMTTAALMWASAGAFARIIGITPALFAVRGAGAVVIYAFLASVVGSGRPRLGPVGLAALVSAVSQTAGLVAMTYQPGYRSASLVFGAPLYLMIAMWIVGRVRLDGRLILIAFMTASAMFALVVEAGMRITGYDLVALAGGAALAMCGTCFAILSTREALLSLALGSLPIAFFGGSGFAALNISALAWGILFAVVTSVAPNIIGAMATKRQDLVSLSLEAAIEPLAAAFLIELAALAFPGKVRSELTLLGFTACALHAAALVLYKLKR